MADRRYETLVLLHPDLGEPGAKELAERVKKLIEDQGGTVGQVQEWGLRELAYLIAKQRRGLFSLSGQPRPAVGLVGVLCPFIAIDRGIAVVSCLPATRRGP